MEVPLPIPYCGIFLGATTMSFFRFNDLSQRLRGWFVIGTFLFLQPSFVQAADDRDARLAELDAKAKQGPAAYRAEMAILKKKLWAIDVREQTQNKLLYITNGARRNRIRQNIEKIQSERNEVQAKIVELEVEFAKQSTQRLGIPNAQPRMEVPPGEDGSDLTVQAFGKDLLVGVTPPSIFGFQMGISPEEMNLTIKSKGGKPIEEAMPYSMTKRAGVERRLEREIRLFQSDTKDLRDLDLPEGFHLVTFVFAGGKLYKVVLNAKYHLSNASPRNLSSLHLSRNISKQEAEESLRNAESNLGLYDKSPRRAFVDWMDIRGEPGVTLSEFRRLTDTVWQRSFLADLALVPASAYERAGIVRTPYFYITNQSNPRGLHTTVKDAGKLTTILDDSGWQLVAGDESEGIYKRELHSTWIWTEFVEKYGLAYVTRKGEAARKETQPGMHSEGSVPSGDVAKRVLPNSTRSNDRGERSWDRPWDRSDIQKIINYLYKIPGYNVSSEQVAREAMEIAGLARRAKSSPEKTLKLLDAGIDGARRQGLMPALGVQATKGSLEFGAALLDVSLADVERGADGESVPVPRR
jgi:hypothetical protein